MVALLRTYIDDHGGDGFGDFSIRVTTDGNRSDMSFEDREVIFDIAVGFDSSFFILFLRQHRRATRQASCCP